MQLHQDVDLLDLRCNLFYQTDDKSTSANTDCNGEITESTDVEYELEISLLLDMFEKLLHYFNKVHLSDILHKYKDTVLHKRLECQLGIKLYLEIKKKRKILILKQFSVHAAPAVKNIDIESVKDPTFEDFSVGCDKCF